MIPRNEAFLMHIIATLVLIFSFHRVLEIASRPFGNWSVLPACVSAARTPPAPLEVVDTVGWPAVELAITSCLQADRLAISDPAAACERGRVLFCWFYYLAKVLGEILEKSRWGNKGEQHHDWASKAGYNRGKPCNP